ncbi:hypothetical protein GCM10008090_16760 [Arenicella chitinivorans]|uniref:TonB-dependent receptor n=1 Tax=Arenicella chitinivorans TaxID=1329800 RepID=A0A918RRA9_9GAMM|nr:TonB-dependent receptor [Arenicella chitinivorans]GHA07578.1 hypothetical protein GCM10008090_16760 [Arenicella chitinivorans]
MLQTKNLFARALCVAVTMGQVCATAMAAEADVPLDEVLTIGSRADIDNITGSAHLVDAAELDKFEYADIQRITRSIPGVSIQIEDGYGLRPNISIRGVATERSGRITLLEDNVLIAPAPYSAPSAYYFPTAGRMQAFEVVKGPAAITQGPYTIGGALNMVSTAIPTQAGGMVMLEYGQDSTARLLAQYGDTLDNGVGYLLEVQQWQSDGFQVIDKSDADSGLDVTDYMVKLAYAPADSRHSVELKLQKADQDSNQSYLGLTDVDFRANPDRRYSLSELDNIETAHEQAIFQYRFEISESLSLAATAYNNTHERDWFKTEGIDLDGSMTAQDYSGTSWSNVIGAVNTGSDLNGVSATQLNAILNGSVDTAFGSIQLRSNAREYYSRGLQTKLDWKLLVGDVSHEVEVGLRYHEDEEDRLQQNDTYQQINGKLVLNDLGELGNAGNRIQQAEAIALHVYDRIEFGQWTLTPGFRYESIDQSRTRFRDGAQRSFRDARENHTSVFLPGLGAIYRLNNNLSLVAGVHKGFTAPSNSPGVREEEAVNAEFGFRFKNDSTAFEIIGFQSDYSNLLGECTASSGADCEIGDAFNGDAATVRGVEVFGSKQFLLSDDLSLNTQVAYTYIDGQFDTSIADTDFFGDVDAGDPIPYIPEHQLQLSISLDAAKWQLSANLGRVDAVCTRASCGVFEKTDSATNLDFAAQYYVQDNLKLFSRIENVTDERDILGRQPYGARPNKDRTASVGVELRF